MHFLLFCFLFNGWGKAYTIEVYLDNLLWDWLHLMFLCKIHRELSRLFWTFNLGSPHKDVLGFLYSADFITRVPSTLIVTRFDFVRKDLFFYLQNQCYSIYWWPSYTLLGDSIVERFSCQTGTNGSCSLNDATRTLGAVKPILWKQRSTWHSYSWSVYQMPVDRSLGWGTDLLPAAVHGFREVDPIPVNVIKLMLSQVDVPFNPHKQLKLKLSFPPPAPQMVFHQLHNSIAMYAFQ